MSAADSTLIIIPAYNAECTLPQLLQRLNNEYPTLAVLVVDDGSSDSTAQIALSSSASLISRKNNNGKGSALVDGFRWAAGQGYSRIVTMDADLQHDPADLAGLLCQASKRSSSITVGARLISWSTAPWPRVISNKFSSLLLSIFSGAHIPDAQCGYRVLSLDAIVVLPRERGYMFEAESLLIAGKSNVRISSAPVKTIYQNEQSHMKPALELSRFLRILWRGLWL